MEGLAFVFFGTAPFALFCSESGNGIILCIVFLILGGICKWIANGGLEPKIKVEPKDWWETNYKLNMAQGRGHKISKDLADYTTTINRFPMPSEEKKEEIARAMGAITPKTK